MHKLIRCSLIVVLLGLFTAKVFADVKPLLLMDAQVMADLQAKQRAGELSKAQQQLVRHLVKKANALLDQPSPTVINKTLLPPTKDKQDYLSISRYWWPDPTKEDGLPWIRKDGQTNPDTQTDAVDRPRLGRMTKGVKTLALAWYFSGEEKYAAKASDMINTWFLNEDTKMHPHLQYAQSVPGNPKSRRSGILDGRVIPQNVLDAITLISDSGHWSVEQNKAMNDWLSQYLDWLTNSKVGKQGAQQKNNHGSWYRFQVAALARYLNKKASFKEVVDAAKASFAHQFNATGAQPDEVKRTRGFFYSCFNLEALLSLGFMAEQAGLAFWDYRSEDQQNLQLAIDYLLPVVDGKPWPHPVKGKPLIDLSPVLVRAQAYFPDAEYAKSLDKITQTVTEKVMISKVYKKLSLLRPDLALLAVE